MRRPYLALVTAAGLLLAVGASAEAAGRGGGTAPFAPPGLRSTNQGLANPNSHKSDQIVGAPSPTSTSGYGPSGWSLGTQGNANAPNPWKGITGTSPPGLSK